MAAGIWGKKEDSGALAAELRRLMALGLIAKIFDDHGVRDFTQTEGRKRRIEKWFRLTHAVKNI
jgi:hypothetical protein